MSEPTSARVPGHTLLHEGRCYANNGWEFIPVGKAVCSCGARSPRLDSDGKRKAWHRQHKGDVLAARGEQP